MACLRSVQYFVFFAIMALPIIFFGCYINADKMKSDKWWVVQHCVPFRCAQALSMQ